jgi:hypothetical protein
MPLHWTKVPAGTVLQISQDLVTNGEQCAYELYPVEYAVSIHRVAIWSQECMANRGTCFTSVVVLPGAVTVS